MSNYTDRVEGIIEHKAAIDGFLWAHDSGDVILWSSEEDSLDDSGVRAIGRWQLTVDEMDALASLGEIDETA
jgi:hypothetical protein